MTRIPLLPHWVVTDKYPAFYDVESATAIEQTSKLYGKMQELIEDYNKYVDEINKTITEFIEGTNLDQEEFKNRIIKIVHDYIAMIDEKIKQQDEIIEENIVFIKENIEENIANVLNQMKENGELDEVVLNAFNDLETRIANLENTNTKIKLIYNNENESLNFENVEVENI